MRILMVLTYYQPYRSGLTIYAVRLAQELARLGHAVRVLTAQYDRSLPEYETIAGVEVHRLPVSASLSKAAVMPGLYPAAWKWIGWADVVNLHLPQMDGAPLAFLSRLRGKPVVVTYQCDLQLPSQRGAVGLINALANRVSGVLNGLCGSLAHSLVALSQDYADHSSFFQRFPRKVKPVDAPVELPEVTPTDVERFRAQYQLASTDRVIGMVARLAAEKGVEYLVEALPQVLRSFPDARVLYAGQYQQVLGEEAYYQRLAPRIAALGDRWKFLGPISEEEKAAFFRCCELTVLPSTNSTEAFGIVQIESMISGTPVVASDLPGVRQPVLTTGMGKVVPVGDASALAQAMMAILSHRAGYTGDVPQVQKRYAPGTTANHYVEIFQEACDSR
jgi:glycosyltransferase involved in cell wall biosynthesis